MDALDQQLISLLHTNARASLAELAHKLKVSRGTVSNRMHKLETQGVIVGYTVQLKPHNHPTHITAWMSILVEGNDNRRLVANLLGEPSINALYGTNGHWDLLAELKADNLAALSEALERIRLIKGIVNTETSIHLSGYKES